MLVDNKYKVSWEHVNYSALQSNGRKMSVFKKLRISDKKSYTRCVIEAFDEETKKTTSIISSGISKMYAKDSNYNKAIGRKISFKIAVENIPNRDLRTILWRALKESSPKTIKAKV